jgi:hypothetical protein
VKTIGMIVAVFAARADGTPAAHSIPDNLVALLRRRRALNCSGKTALV